MGTKKHSAVSQTTLDFPHVGPLTLSIYQPQRQDGPLPVLYATDGHNLFREDETSWRLHHTLDGLIAAEAMQPVMVVGIHMDQRADGEPFSRSRWLEPVPTLDPEEHEKEGGDSLCFLADLLGCKQIIDERFPTRPQENGLLGSSLGGLFALYAAFKRPDVFQTSASLSPSFFLADRQVLPGSESWIPQKGSWPRRIWMDHGTNEGDHDGKPDPAESARLLCFAQEWAAWLEPLAQLHRAEFLFRTYDLKTRAGVHHESSWAERLKDALPWLYPLSK